jgi:hypothetical protein
LTGPASVVTVRAVSPFILCNQRGYSAGEFPALTLEVT